MTFYESVKVDGGYYIQSLSPCWKPIVVSGYGPYKRKDVADRVACNMSGILPNFNYLEGDSGSIKGMQLYKEELKKYKTQHNMK